MPNDRLRRARERARLSQAELADRAGVSRQLIGSAEAGRHAPAVNTALRIAGVLGESVETLFAAAAPAWSPVRDAPVRDGELVVVGRVGERLCAAPLEDPAGGEAGWGVPDGIVEDGEIRLFPGADANALVVVGCDPLLGLCEKLLSRGGARRVVAVSGSTGSGLAALRADRAHAAVVHGPSGSLPDPPEGVLRVHLARWRVGIGVGGTRPAGSLGEILERGVPMVQRETSASSQQALARAVGDAAPHPAARATGHVDAARRAARGGCAAVTFEPAAHRHGLRFLPLETHAVELWIGRPWVDHPGANALIDLLGSAALRDRVVLVGGYDLADCGSLAASA